MPTIQSNTAKVTQSNADAVLSLVTEWLAKHGYTLGPDGPNLIMEWCGGVSVRPAILLEGGPYDWAVDCCASVQNGLDRAGIPVFVEPYSGWALSLYPN